jgi:hypothetical protein
MVKGLIHSAKVKFLKARKTSLFCLEQGWLGVCSSYDFAYGWGPQGHCVVSIIAESNLAPETKNYR